MVSATPGYHVLEPSWKELGVFNQWKTQGRHGGCFQIWRHILNKIVHLFPFLEIREKQRIEEGTRKQIQLNTREIHRSHWPMMEQEETWEEMTVALLRYWRSSRTYLFAPLKGPFSCCCLSEVSFSLQNVSFLIWFWRYTEPDYSGWLVNVGGRTGAGQQTVLGSRITRHQTAELRTIYCIPSTMLFVYSCSQ